MGGGIHFKPQSQSIRNMPNNRNVLSLFSSAGIGELGVKACGFKILLSNELLKNRCSLYSENYPETKSLCGDIWELQDTIYDSWQKFNVGAPFLVYATPPCQGMSFNSVGKRQQEIRAGRKPKDDPRNRLIIPTVQLVKRLKPKWLLLENVQEMQNTIIPLEDGSYKNIIDYIREELGSEYVGGPEVVNCADYGIPQTRVRLITMFTSTANGKAHYKKHGSFLPPRTHSENGDNKTKKWVTLREIIGSLPHLSSEVGKNVDSSNPLHFVPIMKPEKFWWVQNTPTNESAYNNQCVECGFDGNTRHGMTMKNGRHISKKDTPIFCEKCGALLPRPTMIDKETGQRRIIKGFDSAYRRMTWDSPAGTLTQNFQYEASDKKIHPDQNRVLSIYEGLCLQTIADYDYKFSIDRTPISPNTCCQVIGESVPPRLIEIICRNIIQIENN